jgi:hypothetical protein
MTIGESGPGFQLYSQNLLDYPAPVFYIFPGEIEFPDKLRSTTIFPKWTRSIRIHNVEE